VADASPNSSSLGVKDLGHDATPCGLGVKNLVSKTWDRLGVKDLVTTWWTQEAPSVEEVQRQRQSLVRFDFAATTIHEIVPYAEIFGIHPSDFVFDREYNMLPDVAEADSDSDVDDFEDFDVEYVVNSEG